MATGAGAHSHAVQQVPPLSAFTTLRVGGAPRALIAVDSFEQAVQACADLDEAGTPYFPLGGGSNLVVADEGVDAVALWMRNREVAVQNLDGTAVAVTVGAGLNWDDFVTMCSERTWSGVEALSGIPGTVGATPIQNVGAYGAQVSDVITGVQVWDRSQRRVCELDVTACAFDYRDSALKRARRTDGSPEYVVVSVTFRLVIGEISAPVRYAELAAALGVDVGQCSPAAKVRDAVLALRAGKGMLLDEADHDSWSVGSFFINPVVAASKANALPVDAPRWPIAGSDKVKLSAAWLVEHSGISRGFQIPGSGAAVSHKHALALTNRGTASAQEIVDLARTISNAVFSAFNVQLQPEPVLLGVSL